MPTTFSFANLTTTPDADQRLIALLLTRTLRALRSRRLERASNLIAETTSLLEMQHPSESSFRAAVLLEALSEVGYELDTGRKMR